MGPISPDISYVVPTVGRPSLFRLLETIRRQKDVTAEVIVVFDGVPSSLARYDETLVRQVRLPKRQGTSRSRNTGASLARGSFISFVDDDDWLAQGHAITALTRLSSSPEAGVVVGGIIGVGVSDSTIAYERNPAHLSPQGRHWSLSTDLSWQEGLTKQSAVFRRSTFETVGKFSENLVRRQWTEMFWRTNESSAIVGHQEPVYFRSVYHPNQRGSHLGGPSFARWRDFQRLVRHSRALLTNHPDGFRRLLDHHVTKLKSDRKLILSSAAQMRNEVFLQGLTGRCGACDP